MCRAAESAPVSPKPTRPTPRATPGQHRAASQSQAGQRSRSRPGNATALRAAPSWPRSEWQAQPEERRRLHAGVGRQGHSPPAGQLPSPPESAPGKPLLPSPHRQVWGPH